ncbi:MAG: hypothetical protein O3A96_16005, partial [Proteobacteria bacterium]|nr:hypothetical protein [Pseudomonadota bacterium]
MTDRPDKTDAERPLPSATIVIEAFGGIRPMAAKLDTPVTTVQGWKERDSIPKRRWAEVRQAAEAQGLNLDAAAQGAAQARDVIAMPADKGADSPEKPAGEKPAVEKPAAETQATPAAAGKGATPWSASVPEDEIIDKKAAKDAPPKDAPRETAGAARSATPPVPPRPARRGMGAWPWIVLIFIAAGAAVTWGLWWPTVEQELDRAGILSSTPSGSAPAAAPDTQDMTSTTDSSVPGSKAEAPAGGSASTASPTPAGAGADGQSVQAEIAALKESLRALQTGGGGAADGKIAALEKQVQALSGTIETRFSGPENQGATKAVESALAELRAENARLTEQVTALRKSVQAMDQRLDAAEKRAGGEEVLMLAVGQLRAALARGAPFRQELSALEGLSAEDEALAETIAPLWSHASVGVETQADLRARFASLAPEVLSAEQAAAGGWTDRILAKLNDVVTIRRVGGDVEGDGADALVAR